MRAALIADFADWVIYRFTVSLFRAPRNANFVGERERGGNDRAMCGVGGEGFDWIVDQSMPIK